MKTFRIVMTVGCLAAALAAARSALAFEPGVNLGGEFRDKVAAKRAAAGSWHQFYYDPAWGMPTALVVPPTVCHQFNYSWGAGGTRISRVPYQFSQQPLPPTVYNVRLYVPTPPWPTRTEQFGDYYVRGPR
jgi:hypothetical protein